MTTRRIIGRLAVTACAASTVAGCTFQGLNSLPLPGTVGHDRNAITYHAELANVGTLESNSPVMLGNVIIGTVGPMTFDNWHVDIEFTVRPDVLIPANAVATVGQTSLLGSMHLAVDPPAGQSPQGRLAPNGTLPLATSTTYPSTEQTLSVLSSVVNGGTLGRIGDVIHSFNQALSGNQPEIRDLLIRLNDLLDVLAAERDNIVATTQSLSRLAGKLAAQDTVIADALTRLPKALEVLSRERPALTTALEKLREFSDTGTRVITASKTDLVANLENLAPTFRALADVGPQIDSALAAITRFPYNQDTIDRGLKGDYMNFWGVIDLTIPRLKRTMFMGTRWGDNNTPLVPMPGEPFGVAYTTDPLSVPINPPPLPSDPDSPPSAVPPGQPDSSAPPAVADPQPAPPVQGGN